MLNHKFFDQQTNDNFFLGDRCHQQQKGAVPVWVVTDLRGNILISNKAIDKNAWVVTGGRITINRMFQASTAMLVLAVDQVNVDELYPELPKSVARSVGDANDTNNSRATWAVGEEGKVLYYPLDKNDEIAIWCGYIEGMRTITKDEDLVNSRLIRRFVGVIDTITCSGTSTQGVTMIIQCRDRIKYLMDSIGTFNTADFDPLSPGAASASSYDIVAKTEDGKEGNPKKGDRVTIKRADVILEIARRCIGHLGGSLSLRNLAGVCNSVCGTRIHPGYISEYTQEKQPSVDFQSMYDLTNVNNEYIGTRTDTELNKPVPFIGGKTRNPQSLEIQPDLTFNIITGRLPYKVKGMKADVIGSVQGITDRVPAEFIKFLSFQEPWPTEFFCDSRSGEYWYAPRGLDISGLVDPKRFYRTYFFRNAPEGAVDYLVESSKGIVENYKVQLAKSKANAATDSTNEKVQIINIDGEEYHIREKQVLDHFTDIGSRSMEALSLWGMTPWADDITDSEREFIAKMRQKEEEKGWIFGENRDIRLLESIRVVFADTTNRVASASPATEPNTSNVVTAPLATELIKQPDKPGGFGNAIHSAQVALLYREESSAINWRSNIIVINQPTNDTNNQSAVHLKLDPPWLKGRNFACSYFQAIDTTVGNNQAELVSVAMAYARIFSKELKAATLHIPGDPSIVPGEAVQVVGAPMHPESFVNDPDKRGSWKWDRLAVVDYVSAYRDLYVSRLEAHKAGDLGNRQPGEETEETIIDTDQTTSTEGDDTQTTTPAATQPADPNDRAADVRELKTTANNVQTINNTETLAQAQIMCPATFGRKTLNTNETTNEQDAASISQGTSPLEKANSGSFDASKPSESNISEQAKENLNLNTITFPEDPKTIWRVEAVIDKFNEDQSGSGYRTELALLSPF